LGVIRDYTTETYDHAVNKQIAEVRAKSKIKTFDDLVDNCEKWEI
jgi:2-oxoglutarate/2-oxoacid ferredoxin oxidoreductase subunit beta